MDNNMPIKKPFKSILIIDDDPTCVYLTKLTLEDLDIAEQILTASHGNEGLQIIKKLYLADKAERPYLILLDINMPIMSGIELIEELIKMGENQLIEPNIAVLTTSSHSRDMEKMENLGVKHYFTKPITEEKILSIS
jgi:CheY-like chemotaxis protein